MTNDELQAICESNARAIAALTHEASEERARRSTNTDEIETLLGAVSSNETACRDLRQTATLLTNAIAESNQRFDTLRNDAIADRQESDQRFEALRNDAIADRQESDQRFEALRNDAVADRQESEQRFEALRNDAVADRQESKQRFEALRNDAIADRQESKQRFEALRNDAIADRQESKQRFEAQQEIIQTLLAQLIATNQDVAQAKDNVSGLSDRVSDLEVG